MSPEFKDRLCGIPPQFLLLVVVDVHAQTLRGFQIARKSLRLFVENPVSDFISKRAQGHACAERDDLTWRGHAYPVAGDTRIRQTRTPSRSPHSTTKDSR